MRKNPYPKGYGFELNPADSFSVPTRVDTTKNYYGKQLDNVNVYKSILNIKKR
jgi:hypothetical protein